MTRLGNKKHMLTRYLKSTLLGSLFFILLPLSVVAVANNALPESPIASNNPTDSVSVKTASTQENGFYVRGQLGLNKMDLSLSSGSGKHENGTSKSMEIRANVRAAAGYNFNKYLSVELGAAWLYKGSASTPRTSIDASIVAADALAKGTYGFGKLYAFGGAGLALVHFAVSSNSINRSNNFIRPKIAAGVGYNINPRLSMDLEYARIFGSGDSVKIDPAGTSKISFLPAINAISIGLNYKFNALHRA